MKGTMGLNGMRLGQLVSKGLAEHLCKPELKSWHSSHARLDSDGAGKLPLSISKMQPCISNSPPPVNVLLHSFESPSALGKYASTWWFAFPPLLGPQSIGNPIL